MFSLELGYSDFEAIWFSSNEDVSEEFAENRKSSDDNEIIAMFKVHLKSSDIASIDYELSQEINDFYGYYDFRESIDMLVSEGFEGWKTIGSIGYTQYDDYAVFDEDIIEEKAIKFYINDEWTEYIPINQAQDFLNSF